MVLEAPAFVAGFDDLAVVGETVELRGGHLGIAEHAGPFAKGQVGSDDDGCAFVEFADQVEQELPAGLGKGQIAQFIGDQEVEAGAQIGGPALQFGSGFGVELVHQIDDVEEPAPASGPDARPGNADGEVDFAGACAADQHQVALVIKEVAGGKITDQGLVDISGFEVELFQLLCQGQLGDGHLVFDRPRLLLPDLGGEQIADDLLRFMLRLTAVASTSS